MWCILPSNPFQIGKIVPAVIHIFETAPPTSPQHENLEEFEYNDEDFNDDNAGIQALSDDEISADTVSLRGGNVVGESVETASDEASRNSMLSVTSVGSFEYTPIASLLTASMVQNQSDIKENMNTRFLKVEEPDVEWD